MELSRKKWEYENDIMELSEEETNFYACDEAAQKTEVNAKKWKEDANYFKKVRISAVALIKMVTHTASGGNIEVMGLMLGKIKDQTMYVLDSFALPVEGTETRVNAAQEGYEYMVNYVTKAREVGRLENVLGWYHSHPGYGCWLSGIDVATQMLNQQFQEPFVAIVIDPIRTGSAGKVEIGAFRTYPESHTSQDSSNDSCASIPPEKIEDFGVHCRKYYQLEVSYFKTKQDSELLRQLWTKYWTRTLANSRYLGNQGHRNKVIKDLAKKLASSRDPETLAKVSNEGKKVCYEVSRGYLGEDIKNHLCG